MLARIALRFLFRATRKNGSVSLFTFISVLGITFSVTLFFLIDALIYGLGIHLRDTLIGFEAPNYIQVSADQVDEIKKQVFSFGQKHHSLGLTVLDTQEFEGLAQILGQNPTGVKARTASNAFLKYKQQLEIFWDEGMTPDLFAQSSDLVLVGETLYQRLRFHPGQDEKITLTHPFADLGPSGEIEPSQKELRVAGIFSTGRVEFDDVFLLLPRPVMNLMANPYLLTNTLYIYPRDNQLSEALKAQWNQAHKPVMKSWQDKNKNVIKAMRLEKLMYFVIFIFVILISAFNLAGVIAIFSLSKAEDSAVLRTVGFSSRQIRGIYSFLGLFLGAGGAILGTALGLGLVGLLEITEFQLPKAYGFTQLPLAIQWSTLWGLWLITPLVAALVAYIPAWRLNRQTVAEVLRLG